MACDLTTGRTKIKCASFAGIKTVFFSTDALGTITYNVTNTDSITTFAGTPVFFEYNLKKSAANTFDAGTPQKDAATGTTLLTQTLNVQLPKMDRATHKEFKLLLYSSPTVIVFDNNGNYLVMGLENGADMTGGSILTGGGGTDFNGYTLIMTAEEKAPANYLDVDIPTTTATISGTQTDVDA